MASRETRRALHTRGGPVPTYSVGQLWICAALEHVAKGHGLVAHDRPVQRCVSVLSGG